ncbi:MAG: DNA polymerase III subunit beta [Gammaproteobacteria bacterium]
MKISIDREHLLGALQAVANVVERRQTLPILSNVLISVDEGNLSITATDMEVEAIARVEASVGRGGALTVPGRKLLDICRSLPAQSLIVIEEKDKKLRIQSGRSRFVLSTLPAAEYPTVGYAAEEVTFATESAALQQLIASTQFAMAHQDVRYYLNGLLLELLPNAIKAVATDGHRLALNEVSTSIQLTELRQLIVPRKGVMEIQRLATHAQEPLQVGVAANVLRIGSAHQTLTIKLVDGKFPDYERVLPKGGNKVVVADREQLKAALQRTSILSNEKFRGVRLNLSRGLLKASAHNPEQEEAEEEIEVTYDGEGLEIGFNVSYLLDVLSVLGSENIQLILSDANSSCLIEEAGTESMSRYVVMPMRL